MNDVDTVALIVFLVLFAGVTVLGFVASRWKAASLDSVDEWGLGGRRFGGVITWFLLGGDLYTAYTFVAVPALVFGAGAAGFFALPYTILVFPFVFVVMPRLWAVSHARGYVTPADFVRGRYRSRELATVVALTGLLATMPYIALQLVGIEVVLKQMGIQGDWPLIIAFAVLAFYTYQSGLRAPALIAIVKDTLIYITIIVAVVYIPSKLGGFGAIFGDAARELPKKDPPGALIPQTADAQTAYATLAIGSALALFLYPHALTAVFSARSANTIRKNATVLPAYTFLLGLIALLGYMALSAGIQVDNPNQAVPALFEQFFPGWFEGFAFAAIAIGALVPSAVMSIAAANLFSRNIYREFLRPDATDKQESQVAKIASLVVKLGALLFIVLVPTKYAIEFQLLGGVWILQTLPSLVIGLYTRWLDRRALLVGWAAGMIFGTAVAQHNDFTPTSQLLGVMAYTGIWAVSLNLLVSGILTLVLRAAGAGDDRGDDTRPDDYEERGEVAEDEPLPATPEQREAKRRGRLRGRTPPRSPEAPGTR